MKKTTILLVFLICTTVVITGCSSGKQAVRNRQWQGRNQNLTEEERQKLFEERQQKAIESCQDKKEEDKCLFENPQGQIEGTCKTMDSKLLCTPNGQMRQR